MSVRQAKRRDPATGLIRERWIVDVDFQHPDGGRERVRKISPVQTRQGAEEYERQLRMVLLDPRHRRSCAPTFKDFVTKRWWPTYPDAAGNGERTKREKEGHLRLYLRPAFDELPLDAITGERVERLFASLAERNISAKTRRNVRATLRRILASAVEWGVIDVLPHLPRVKVATSRFDFFVREESDQLVAAARNDDERALLLFALHTGVRAGEQLALEWRDIDFESELVFVRRAFSLGVPVPPKSGHERTVPLSATLAEVLHAIAHSRGPLVFCNVDGSPLSIWQLHERLWSACRRAGLRRIRWHDLRHSFASQLVMAGVPLIQVQQWLGHSTITMTMRYAHLARGTGDALIHVLDGTSGNLTATQRHPESGTREMA